LNGLARQKMKYEETLTMTQFSVFIVYMFLYFPFGITAIGGQRSDYPDIFHTVAIYMCYSNSCFNCILYGVLNKNMRRSYRQALPCINRKYSVKVHPTSVSGKIQQRNVSTHIQSFPVCILYLCYQLHICHIYHLYITSNHSIHLTRWRLRIHRLLSLGYVSLLYLSWNRRRVNFHRIFTVNAW
jgi:hypothetical protein